MVGIDKTSVTASRIINARLYPAVSRPFPSTRVTHTGCSRSTDLWFMKVRNVFSTKYATGVRLIRAETLHEQNDIAHCLSVEKKVFSRPPRPPYFSSLSLSLLGREEETIAMLVIFLSELSGRSDGKRDSPAPDAINSLLTKQTLNRGPPLRKYSLLYVIKTGIRYGYTEHVDKINW